MRKGTREEASCLQHLGTGTLCSARKCADVSAFAELIDQTQFRLLAILLLLFHFLLLAARRPIESRGKVML
jgi:hypothetical protein